MTQENREKFVWLAGRYNQIIKFYDMEKLFPNFIEMMPESMHNRIKSPRFTAGTLYRLLIDRVLSADVEKVIYLDSDIIVNLNIKELWQIELKDHPIAAVTLFDNSVENKRNEPVHNVPVLRIEAACRVYTVTMVIFITTFQCDLFYQKSSTHSLWWPP